MSTLDIIKQLHREIEPDQPLREFLQNIEKTLRQQRPIDPR